ncbi:RNA polymerase subunit sigma-24, partial [Clostridium perfringens]
MSGTDTHRTIDAIWRIESSKIIAYLTRMVRDVGIAEDLAQDALIAARERWPIDGIGDNPGGWLMTAAKRKALDLLRRNKVRDQKYELLGRDMDSRMDSDIEVPEAGEVNDDLLRLIFMTCHPVLSPEARVALT